MANRHELPISSARARRVHDEDREARASAGIAGLVLVGVSGIELMFSGSQGLPYLATALLGVALVVSCIVSSR